MMIAKKDDPAVTIRFPPAVLDGVTAAAKQNKRSRNTEVIARLHQSLNQSVRGAVPKK